MKNIFIIREHLSVYLSVCVCPQYALKTHNATQWDQSLQESITGKVFDISNVICKVTVKSFKTLKVPPSKCYCNTTKMIYTQ